MLCMDNALLVDNLSVPPVGTVGLPDLPSLISCNVILKSLLLQCYIV